MSRRRVAAALLLLAVLTLAAFSPVLMADFVNYDDGDYVTGNPMVRAGLTMEGLRWAFTTFHASNWHPLTWLSHMLDVELFGMRPWGHHLTSVLIHLATAWLLFLFLAPATGAFGASLLAAALFAVHPLRVESVAWIAERKDLLAGLFFVLTLHAWRRYAARPSLARYLAAALLFALGLLAKPMLVTLPFVLLLIDLWPLGRRPGIRLFLEKLPLLALSAASSVLTMKAQREALAEFWALPFDTRFANAAVSVFGYVGKALWPVNLAIFYPHPGNVIGDPATIAALAGLLAIGIGCLLTLRSAPFMATGWFWFVGMLVPVSGIVQVGSQGMADRYTYLPLIGLTLALVWGVGRLAAPFVPAAARRWLLPGVTAAILLPLALVTHHQAGFWRDTETLFRRDVEATGGNALAHTILGVERQSAGDLPGAVREFEAALSYNTLSPDSRFNLGMALYRMGRGDEARPHLDFLLAMRPSSPKWRNNIGVILGLSGDLPGAIASFRDALWQRPDYVGARANLANALAKSGLDEEAIREYREVVRLDPWKVSAYGSLGDLLAKSGRPEEAEEVYRRGITLDPSYLEGYFTLAALADGRGDAVGAITLLRRAAVVNPGFAGTHNNLGVLLAKAGRVGEAREAFARAVAIDPGFTEARENLKRVTEGR